MYYSQKEIAEITGNTKNQVAWWVIRAKVKGLRIHKNSEYLYTKKQCQKIMNVSALDFKNHPRKLKVIDMYSRGYSKQNISMELKMSLKDVYKCINEYIDTGEIIVESRISKIFL